MSLADQIIKDEKQAASRLKKDIEDNSASAVDELVKLHPFTGNAHTIGITGPAGVGKSTLADTMIA